MFFSITKRLIQNRLSVTVTITGKCFEQYYVFSIADKHTDTQTHNGTPNIHKRVVLECE